MYYAHQLFVKKGALGKIWLAGTLFKKLSKHAIMSANVEEMVLQIKDPVVKLALCTQARLALGTVRIHGRKAYYLLTDAVEARVSLTKKEQGRINLMGHELEAKPDSITLQPDKSGKAGGVEDELSLNIDQLDPTLDSAFDLNHFSLNLEDVDISGKDLLAREEDITLHDNPSMHDPLTMDAMNLSFNQELNGGLGGDFDLMNATVDGGNTLTTGGGSMSLDLSQRLTMDDQLMTMPQIDETAVGCDALNMNIDTLSLPGVTQDLIGSPLVRKDAAAAAAAAAHDLELSQASLVRDEAPLHLEREEELRKQQRAEERARKKRERQLKKRKRDPKLGFDSITELSDNEIRAQLSDASDIVIVRPTRVSRAQQKSLEELFASPSGFVPSNFFCEDLSGFYSDCVSNKKRSKKGRRGAKKPDEVDAMHENDENIPPMDENMMPQGYEDQGVPQGELWENRSHTGSQISVEMRRGINLPDDQLSVHSRNSFLGRSLDAGGALSSQKAFRDDASVESRDRIMPLDGRRLSLGSSVDGDRAPLRALGNGLDDVPEHQALSQDLMAMNDISFGENGEGGGVLSQGMSQIDGATAVSGSNFASTVASQSMRDGEPPSPGIPASQIPISEETEFTEKSVWSDIPEVSRLTMIFRSELQKKMTDKEVLSNGRDQKIHLHDIWNSYAPVSRRDASLCFLQLLVLKSMNVVQVKQPHHRAPIAITKGPRYDAQFSESQFS